MFVYISCSLPCVFVHSMIGYMSCIQPIIIVHNLLKFAGFNVLFVIPLTHPVYYKQDLTQYVGQDGTNMHHSSQIG